jgi:hypothetical protein
MIRAVWNTTKSMSTILSICQIYKKSFQLLPEFFVCFDTFALQFAQMMRRFKEKWNIESNWQLALILIVFSLTGSAALVVRKLVFGWMGITPETAWWIKAPLYIAVLFPAYQVLLLIVGTTFGQFRFFYAFQKKSMGFMCRKRKNSDIEA